MTDKPVAELSFEAAMAELEAIVGQLEAGEVPLEQSIALYKRGDALRRHCEAKLAEARAQVEQIALDADGKPAGTEAGDFE